MITSLLFGVLFVVVVSTITFGVIFNHIRWNSERRLFSVWFTPSHFFTLRIPCPDRGHVKGDTYSGSAFQSARYSANYATDPAPTGPPDGLSLAGPSNAPEMAAILDNAPVDKWPTTPGEAYALLQHAQAYLWNCYDTTASARERSNLHISIVTLSDVARKAVSPDRGIPSDEPIAIQPPTEDDTDLDADLAAWDVFNRQASTDAWSSLPDDTDVPSFAMDTPAWLLDPLPYVGQRDPWCNTITLPRPNQTRGPWLVTDASTASRTLQIVVEQEPQPSCWNYPEGMNC
jgi:hypothetical protein